MSDTEPTARLVLVDTVDQLPGLLPLHAFSALRSCDLIILGAPDHPFVEHLEMAEERFEVIPEDVGVAALGRQELLAGLSLVDKARATWVLDRAHNAGSVGYIFGPTDSDAFTRTLGMEAAKDGVEVEVVYFGLAPKGVAFLDLVDVQQTLLAPDGCPWDAEQTHESLANFAIEEAHELAEAIAEGDPKAIAEELGDVLMQVVFHAELSAEFDIDEVARGISAKLVRRHPHVFADGRADTSAAVVTAWEDIKAAEKPERTGPFDGVPRGLPAIALASKIQSRAERSGLAPGDEFVAAERVADAVQAVLDAPDADRADHVGDLLFSAISLARRWGVDPEHALRAAVVEFRKRFQGVLDALAAEDIDPGNPGLQPEEWHARLRSAQIQEEA